VVDAQKAIYNKTAKKNELDSRVKNAKKAVDELSKDVDSKETALTSAKQKVATAKSDLNNTQNKVNNLQNKVDSINFITMPKNYWTYNKWGGESGVNKKAAEEGLQINHYKDDKESEKETVAHNADGVIQLTDAQQKELTLWAAGILNNVRVQLGYKPNIIVNPLSLKYTNYIATHSTVPTFDHDDAAITAAGNLVPMLRVQSQSIGVPFYAENMNDVKKGAWAHMLSMIFDDAASGWGHAYQLTGCDSQGWWAEFFGVSLRKDKGFIQFDSFASEDADLEKGKLPIPNYDNLKSELAVAKTVLASKQSAYDSANATTQSAAKAYNEASSELAQANQAYTSAKDAYDSADVNLNRLNQSLVSLNSNLENAKKAYADLTASTSDKQKKVSEATDNYNSAQTKLTAAKENTVAIQKLVDKAQADLDQAKAQLSQAQANQKQAQDKLNSLEKKLNDLENAGTNAEKAAQQLATATEKLNDAKKLSNQLTEKLTDANKVLAEKEAALTNAKNVLAKIEKEEAAKEAVKKAQEEAKKTAEEKAEHTNFYKAGDKLVDGKGQFVPSGYTVKDTKVYNVKGEFVGVVSNQVQSRFVARAINRIKEQEASSVATSVSKHAEIKASSVLPRTGSSDSNNSIVGAIGLAIASVGSLLGLASSKRKER
jgi:SEC10/PgrA surface exclusion-like protein/LPXTG-motif cell wall-anchored protein